MKAKIILIVVLAVLLAGSGAFADTFVTSGVWTSVPLPNENKPPFWDNPSQDGSKRNVGYILTGKNDPLPGEINFTTQDYINYGGGTAQYLNDGSGGVVNDFYFTNNAGGQSAYLIIEIAGYEARNYFGVYDKANPDNLTVIFTGGSSNSTTWQGTVPYASYGFFLVYDSDNDFGTKGNAGLLEEKNFFRSVVADGNPGGDNRSNFAFFRDSRYPLAVFMGMEDLINPIAEGRLGDYNDMIVKVQVVPLPGALLLLAAGLLRLAAYARKRRDQV